MTALPKNIIKTISIDCVIFGYADSTLEVLLRRRATGPSKGMWSLPGGFVKKEERVLVAAQRVLQQTTGVRNTYLEEVGVFDAVDRYPAWRVFTIGHVALISPDRYALKAGSDSSEVRWFPLGNVPRLPFDHVEIMQVALEKLRKRVRYQPIGFEILPKKFTLPQLQRLYEVILGKDLDKRNFRKKILGMHFVKRLTETDRNSGRRPAFLYEFDATKYGKLQRKGFMFEL
ncbi:MAG: NUDIX domain-containing protein [Ignavibacteriae bacterium]|nr:NUDIX domain-containing protein [Ignavibacteriota bacterium]